MNKNCYTKYLKKKKKYQCSTSNKITSFIHYPTVTLDLQNNFNTGSTGKVTTVNNTPVFPALILYDS